MKKFLLSAFVVITFAGYALQQRFGSEGVPVGTNSITLVDTPTPATAQGSSTPTGNYRDGQYTGTVVDAYYGNVQVKAIITGGKISDVQFLQYPSDRQTSRMINSQAMPYLTQEAIQTQSANVNGVSGATATSRAFIQSLTAALTQAK